MQIILTEEEYNKLKAAGDVEAHAHVLCAQYRVRVAEALAAIFERSDFSIHPIDRQRIVQKIREALNQFPLKS